MYVGAQVVSTSARVATNIRCLRQQNVAGCIRLYRKHIRSSSRNRHYSAAMNLHPSSLRIFPPHPPSTVAQWRRLQCCQLGICHFTTHKRVSCRGTRLLFSPSSHNKDGLGYRGPRGIRREPEWEPTRNRSDPETITTHTQLAFSLRF